MKTIILDTVDSKVISELEKARLNLSHLWLLELFYTADKSENGKIEEDFSKLSVYQTLQRKGYIIDSKITSDGKILYELIASLVEGKNTIVIGNPELTVARKTRDNQFEEWWSTFPSTDRITDTNGIIIFKESRSLRGGKEYCKDKYIKLLAEGYKHEDLMRSLNYEISLRKLQSVEEGENKLKFMQNTKTYLYQKSFEAFIDLSKEDIKGKNSPGTIHI